MGKVARIGNLTLAETAAAGDFSNPVEMTIVANTERSAANRR
ncbi:hypothetical protein BH20CHL4_BH20CHL4_08460 [soil metagenome]